MSISIDILEASTQAFIKYQVYTAEDGLSELRNIETVISICTNLWHLTDNVWNEYNDSLNKTYSGIGEFRTDLIGACEELAILHDITTKRKHATVSKPKSEFSELQVYEGSALFFSDSPAVLIVMKNGEKRNVIEVIQKVLQFWSYYIYGLR